MVFYLKVDIVRYYNIYRFINNTHASRYIQFQSRNKITMAGLVDWKLTISSAISNAPAPDKQIPTSVSGGRYS
jgi:hypothetical protein